MSKPAVTLDADPVFTGMYVAYINPDINVPYAQRQIMYYDAQARKWGYPGTDVNYRDHVYGWIGPLPALKLETSTEDQNEPS